MFATSAVLGVSGAKVTSAMGAAVLKPAAQQNLACILRHLLDTAPPANSTHEIHARTLASPMHGWGIVLAAAPQLSPGLSAETARTAAAALAWLAERAATGGRLSVSAARPMVLIVHT